MISNRILTATEAAEILKCHRSTVQRMAASGRFPNAKSIGNGQRKNWRIPETDWCWLLFGYRKNAINDSIEPLLATGAPTLFSGQPFPARLD